MKIKYCTKYEKYVSQYHCELFNNGKSCPYYSEKTWESIKKLMKDTRRPRWRVDEIIKPFHCHLLDREYYNNPARRRRPRISTRYQEETGASR